MNYLIKFKKEYDYSLQLLQVHIKLLRGLQ